MPQDNLPLSHISIGVRNFEKSRKFYSATLSPLGLRLVYERHTSPSISGPRTLGYGPDEENEIITVFEHGNEAHAPGRGCHIAFNASSHSIVVAFYEAAIANGGMCNGKPGLREHYGQTYFAAFVIDPDGWRLEAVCKSAPPA
jgi:catechol 2,3-dioxygenase-like lactoylglutathione lyase family enzyme